MLEIQRNNRGVEKALLGRARSSHKWSRLSTPLLGVLLFTPVLLGEGAVKTDHPDMEVSTRDPEPSDRVPRPPFQDMRFEEDWSVLGREDSLSWPENLKYVSLGRGEGRFLSLGGQLRLRSETWRDFGFGGEPGRDDTYGLSRLRLHTDWQLGPHFRFFVEGLSALSTGRGLPGGDRILDVDSADFQNTFVDLRFPTNDGSLTLRVGRRELQFGRQRLVSPLDWSNTRPRSFDGIQGIYRTTGWRLDGFWTRHVRTRKYALNSSTTSGTDLYGFYAAGRLDSAVSELDVYWLGLTRRSATYGGVTGKEQRQTFGLRAGGRAPEYRLDFDLEVAAQLGDHAGREIRSWMAASRIGHSPTRWTGPRFFVGLDLASGDRNPGDRRVGTFNHLFPLGHAYFGDIDMVGRQNILDFNQGVVLRPAGRLALTAELHRFWRMSREDALYDAGGGVVRRGDLGRARSVGSEVDLRAALRINRHTSLSGGYAHFFPGAFVEESGPSEGIDFLFLILQMTF
jgi:hypothetical protein